MTPSPAAGDAPRSTGVDPEALVASAVEVLEATTSLSELDEAHTELLGKRSALARAHQALASLEPARASRGRAATQRGAPGNRVPPRRPA